MLPMPTEIATSRFLLKPLTIDDISDRYASWLMDKVVQQFISTASSTFDLDALRQYVLERIGREDIVFLGIFDKNSGFHIGNIKYEPVNSELGYAIMGILIGESDWRAKGVAAEVISASAEWLQRCRKIRQIILGVARTNTAAIRAYHKIGFVEESDDHVPGLTSDNLKMTWRLD